MMLQSHTSSITGLIQLANGLMLSGSSDKTIKVWNITTGNLVNTFNNPNGVGALLELSSNNWVAAALTYCSSGIWNIASGSMAKTLNNHTNSVLSLIELWNGLLASGSGSVDKTIKIWNVTTGAMLKSLASSSGVYSIIQLTNDTIGSGTQVGTIQIWNITSGTVIYEMGGHIGAVRSLVKLTPGLLASGSEDYTIKIWDLVSLVCVDTLYGHLNLVQALVKTPNGQLISGSSDGTFKIWGSYLINLNFKDCLNFYFFFKLSQSTR